MDAGQDTADPSRAIQEAAYVEVAPSKQVDGVLHCPLNAGRAQPRRRQTQMRYRKQPASPAHCPLLTLETRPGHHVACPDSV